MPSLQDYERDYHSGDREEVLGNIRRYGTDDRSQWSDAPAQSTFHGSQNPGIQTFNQPSGSAPQGSQTNVGQWNAHGQQNTGTATQAANPGLASTSGSVPFDRTAFRDAWMATGSDKAAQDRLLQQHRLTLSPNGTAILPTGEAIDLRYAARVGGTQATWTNAGGTQNGVPVTGAGGGGGGNSLSVSPGFLTPGGSPGGTGSMKDQLYQTLLKRMNQSETPDKNDPVIRAQADAFSANQTRSQRNYLADLAEKSGPSANLRGETRLASERAGQASGAFESELVGRELVAKRDQIQQAISQLGNSLSQDEALAVQKYLGELNNAIQQQQVANQGRGLDQQWQSTLLNNEQFNRDLGLRAEDRSSYWDAIRSGLL